MGEIGIGDTEKIKREMRVSGLKILFGIVIKSGFQGGRERTGNGQDQYPGAKQ